MKYCGHGSKNSCHKECTNLYYRGAHGDDFLAESYSEHLRRVCLPSLYLSYYT